MRTIRNAYQKLVRAQPSGSAAVGKTDRQREIIRLAGFLREHVKTVATVTSYKGRSSPATKKPNPKATQVPQETVRIPLIF